MTPIFSVLDAKGTILGVFEKEVEFVFVDMEVEHFEQLFKVTKLTIDTDSKRVIADCYLLRDLKPEENGTIDEEETRDCPKC